MRTPMPDTCLKVIVQRSIMQNIDLFACGKVPATMKVQLVALILCLCLSSSHGNPILERLKEMKAKNITLSSHAKAVGNEFKEKFTNMGSQLKEVGSALKDVAVDSTKSLASQSLQALAGAVLTSFKEFDLKKILFGKREIFDLESSLQKLLENTHEALDSAFRRTFTKITDLLNEVFKQKNLDKTIVQRQLRELSDDHVVAIRGIISDTLNTGIDLVKSLWAKAKNQVEKAKNWILGEGHGTNEPLMIGKRSMKELTNELEEKLKSISDVVIPHLDRIASIIPDITRLFAEQDKEELRTKLSSFLNENLKELAAKAELIKENLRNL